MSCRSMCEVLTHRDLDFWGGGGGERENKANMHKLSDSMAPRRKKEEN